MSKEKEERVSTDNETLEAVAKMFEQADEEAQAFDRKKAEDALQSEIADTGKNVEAKKEKADEAQKDEPEQLTPANEGSTDKKKKEKDPMLEMVDELNDFVKAINDDITNFVKEKGQAAWDKLQDTQPMKTLNGALDAAKQFGNDKIDETVDKVVKSDAVQDAKSFISDVQKTINDSFSSLMNMAANKVSDAIYKAISPSDNAASQPTFETDGIDDGGLDAQAALENDSDSSMTMSSPTDSLVSSTSEPMESLTSMMSGHEGLSPEPEASSVANNADLEQTSGLTQAL